MIKIGFYTPPITLSSNLPDISVLTDHVAVNVRLSADNNVLLDERYYAMNGNIIISDIASLVEQYMAANTDAILCKIRIEAFVSEDNTDYTDCVVEVLYCDKAIGITNPTDWLKENFLDSGLVGNIDKWRDDRNDVIHDLAKQDMDYNDLRKVAETGRNCFRTYTALIMKLKKMIGD